MAHIGYPGRGAGHHPSDNDERWRDMPPKPENHPGHDDEDEDTLDEELEETFPSSDPPSTGGPGI